jgi:hypothetical protein
VRLSCSSSGIPPFRSPVQRTVPVNLLHRQREPPCNPPIPSLLLRQPGPLLAHMPIPVVMHQAIPARLHLHTPCGVSVVQPIVSRCGSSLCPHMRASLVMLSTFCEGLTQGARLQYKGICRSNGLPSFRHEPPPSLPLPKRPRQRRCDGASSTSSHGR